MSEAHNAIPEEVTKDPKGNLDTRVAELIRKMGVSVETIAKLQDIMPSVFGEQPKKVESYKEYEERMKKQSLELAEAEALEKLKQQSALNQQPENQKQDKNSTVGGVAMQDPDTLKNLNPNIRLANQFAANGL